VKQRDKPIAWILVPILPIILGFLFFSSSGRDDTYITYWPAYSLAESGRMVNYNGERVEQSSSLLQVLILALLRKLTGIDLVYLGYGISIICGSLAVFYAMRLSRSIYPRSFVLSGLLTATSTYLAYWSFGGMETTIYGLLILFMIQSLHRFMNQPNLKFGPSLQLTAVTLSFMISRPESPFTLAGFLILSFVYYQWLGAQGPKDEISIIQNQRKKYQLAAIISILNMLIILAFRKAFFDSFLPQPALAKTAHLPSTNTMISGLKYCVYTWFRSPWIGLLSGIVAVCIILFIIVLLRTKKAPLQILLLVCFAITQLFFIVMSGGDWMEGGRFFVPIIPLLAILVSVALYILIEHKTWRIAVAGALIFFQLVITVEFALSKSTGLPIWTAAKCYRFYGTKLEVEQYSWFEITNQIHLRDIPVIFQLNRLNPRLKKDGGRVCIMSSFMGMVPYHLAMRYGVGRFYFLDINGLIDRNFTNCPATARLPRDSFGLQFSLKKFFALWPEISQQCNIPEPDLLFGAYQDLSELDLYEANGFKVVYIQPGYARDLLPPQLLRPQYKIFIAVHERPLILPDSKS
jgi:hypothetical protein